MSTNWQTFALQHHWTISWVQVYECEMSGLYVMCCIQYTYIGMSDGGDKYSIKYNVHEYFCHMKFNKPTQLRWHLFSCLWLCRRERCIQTRKNVNNNITHTHTRARVPNIQTPSMSSKSNHIMLIQISKWLGLCYV